MFPDAIQTSAALLRTDQASFAMSCKQALATLDAIRGELMLLNVREPGEAGFALDDLIKTRYRLLGGHLRDAKRRAHTLEKRAEEHSLVEGA